jgi:hypothetical protein
MSQVLEAVDLGAVQVQALSYANSVVKVFLTYLHLLHICPFTLAIDHSSVNFVAKLSSYDII